MTDELSAYVRDRMSTYEDDGTEDGADALGDRPDDISPAAWSRLPDDQRRELLDIRAGDGVDAGQDDAAAVEGDGSDLAAEFANRGEFVAWAIGNPADFEAVAGMSPREYVERWTEAGPDAWAQECARTGWPVDFMIGWNNLPFGDSWSREKARREALLAAGDRRGYL